MDSCVFIFQPCFLPKISLSLYTKKNTPVDLVVSCACRRLCWCLLGSRSGGLTRLVCVSLMRTVNAESLALLHGQELKLSTACPSTDARCTLVQCANPLPSNSHCFGFCSVVFESIHSTSILTTHACRTRQSLSFGFCSVCVDRAETPLPLASCTCLDGSQPLRPGSRFGFCLSNNITEVTFHNVHLCGSMHVTLACPRASGGCGSYQDRLQFLLIEYPGVGA